MEKNTPRLWDKLWTDHGSLDEARAELAKEERGVRWRRLERALAAHFGRLAGLEIIEIGAGMGTCAALLARRGARVTILDYSPVALRGAAAFYTREGLRAEFLERDALALPAALLGRFDVAMSFGLTEHFRGPARLAIHKAHLDLIRPGGLAIVSVPNALNPPYRLYKFLAERTGKWAYGEEYPYTRLELARLCRALGVEQTRYLGDSLLASFHFINPLRVSGKLRRLLRVRTPRREPFGWRVATPLDSWLAPALVLVALKPPG